ncbi:protein phosphatase 1 regulatory subunit 35 [Hippocampus zosterae]|uniref:protein phosphatase 1 regulatory subunit 35 n=1 Tax=Hippocampus zosterae TaxID=109293 RepID=UPI00223E88EF|nr:protein phosphatase 1 regulatory subunit 35 [Hippocampus zosterae]
MGCFDGLLNILVICSRQKSIPVHYAVKMKGWVSFLSPPPSPSAAPLPLSSSPGLTLCPELDLSVMASPTPMHSKRPQNKQTRKKRNPKVCFEEPAVVRVIPEPQIQPISDAPPQQPTSNQMRWRDDLRGNQNLTTGILKKRTEGAARGPYDHADIPEEVELNSTLALKAELLALQGAEFNTQKAVQETLQKAEQTKKQINSRATQGINVSRSQTLFTSLVSVDVPTSQLLSQAVKERLILAPPPRSLDNKAAESPSPLIFLTSDLFREKPLPAEEELVNRNPILAPRPASSTFDLYRRRSRWEAAP